MPTVLLVEDDPNQRTLYTSQLRQEGYEVVATANAREALAALDHQSPDVVVMDISMPGMDGIDAMGRMLGRNHKLPVILNTAYASYKNDFRAWSADAYVLKSSDLSELKRAIAQALAGRKQT